MQRQPLLRHARLRCPKRLLLIRLYFPLSMAFRSRMQIHEEFQQLSQRKDDAEKIIMEYLRESGSGKLKMQYETSIYENANTHSTSNTTLSIPVRKVSGILKARRSLNAQIQMSNAAKNCSMPYDRRKILATDV